MMTIKEFAALCGCKTQTLRYYDKIQLLRPVRVDPWSGYRYYSKHQALDFVKIKNLQAADFTIEEIKTLLTMPEQHVYKAFEQKIAEQTQKLEQIKRIQQSYLNETKSMEKLVQNLSEYILRGISDYTVLREFGLSVEDGPAVTARLRAYIENNASQQLPAETDVHLVVDGQIVRGAEPVADTIATLTNYDSTVLLGDEKVQEDEGFTFKNSECIWEAHGWKFVSEFIDSIPRMDPYGAYAFFFRLTEDKDTDGLEFPMFMIAAMLPKVESEACIMGCSVECSDDGKNHFWLRKRK